MPNDHVTDWHPDVIEFIISKMQNPRILRFLIENTNDETIKKHAKDKLKFTPLTAQEKAMYQGIVNYKHIPGLVVLVKKSLLRQKKSFKLAVTTPFIIQNS